MSWSYLFLAVPEASLPWDQVDRLGRSSLLYIPCDQRIASWMTGIALGINARELN